MRVRLAIVLLLLTGIGPLIAWRRATWVNLRKSFLWPGVYRHRGSPQAPALRWHSGMREFYPLAISARSVHS